MENKNWDLHFTVALMLRIVFDKAVWQWKKTKLEKRTQLHRESTLWIYIVLWSTKYRTLRSNAKPIASPKAIFLLTNLGSTLQNIAQTNSPGVPVSIGILNSISSDIKKVSTWLLSQVTKAINASCRTLICIWSSALCGTNSSSNTPFVCFTWLLKSPGKIVRWLHAD